MKIIAGEIALLHWLGQWLMQQLLLLYKCAVQEHGVFRCIRWWKPKHFLV